MGREPRSSAPELPSSAESSCTATLSIAEAIRSALLEIGPLLGLGAPTMVTSRGPDAAWMLALGHNLTIAMQIDGDEPLTVLEDAVVDLDHRSLGGLSLTPPSGVERARLVARAEPAARSETVTETSSPSGSPASTPAATVAKAPTVIPPAVSIVDVNRQLRRALMRGQLAQAEALATTLQHAVLVGDTAAACWAHTITPLLRGIASALSGDCEGSIEEFQALANRPGVDPSITWVRLLWSARASLTTVEGQIAAATFARSALRQSEALDQEAQAVSTLLLAEVNYHLGQHEIAVQMVRSVHPMLQAADDPRDRAEAWLLEAKVLVALGRPQEAMAAARLAHECRPSWPPPVTFITKSVLRSGPLAQIEALVAPLLDRPPVASELERVHRLLEHVRSCHISRDDAYEFLRLLDAPPSYERIEQLSTLVQAHPDVEQFQEALAWHLLRSGNVEAAGDLLTVLTARQDLSDGIRSSVMLAMGCLAAMRARHTKPAAKLRATVEAAPKHMQSSPRPPRASWLPRHGQPLDIQAPGQTPSSGRIRIQPRARTSSRVFAGAPVFSGNLQAFALPDLLEFLRSGQKTGTLLCSSVAGIGAIHLRAGKLTGAMAPHTRLISDFLLAANAVTVDQLRHVADLQQRQSPKPLFGSLLVAQGIVSVEQIRTALREQIQEAVTELIGWSEGNFAFDPEMATSSVSADIEVELCVQGLLLQIFTAKDEAAR